MSADRFLPTDGKTTTQPHVVLTTRRGNRIPNERGTESISFLAEQVHGQQQRNNPGWRARKPPCGGYNCYGMVFANRRTGIWEDWALIGILQDDGYRPLGLDEAPAVGDIVFYYREQRVIHVGLVIHAEPVQILSKMGLTGGEELHEAKLFDGGRSRMEFWTERGNGKPTNNFFREPLITSP